MIKLKDRKRVAADRRIDELLETEAGQRAYWDELEEKGRRSSLIELLESTLHLDGDVIECGVFRGKSLMMECRSVMAHAPDKRVYACDSFEGFPQDAVGDEDVSWFRFKFKLRRKFTVAGDVPDRLERFFAAYGVSGHVVKGFFSDTLGRFADQRFCFMHIDCDLYESHLDCLNMLYDRLVPGGVAVFDDYAQAKWPGATKAVDEFFAGRAEKPALLQSREIQAWYVRKPL